MTLVRSEPQILDQGQNIQRMGIPLAILLYRIHTYSQRLVARFH